MNNNKNKFKLLLMNNFTTITVIIFIIFLILYGSLTFSMMNGILREYIDEDGHKDAENYAERLGSLTKEIRGTVEKYARIPDIKTMDWDIIKSYLREELKYEDSFESFFIMDLNGNYKDTKNRWGKLNIYEKLNLNVEDATKSYIRGPLEIKTNEYVFTIYAPIKDNHEVIGFIGGFISYEYIRSIIDSYKVNHKDSYSYIVCRNTGEVISHKDINMIGQIPNIPTFLQDIKGSKSGKTRYTWNEIDVFAYFHEIPYTDNWALAFRVPTQYIYKTVTKKILSLIIAIVLGVAIFMGIIVLVSKLFYNLRLESINNMESKRKEYEKKIEVENMKSEFFSTISHELKTPLNLIFSSVQLLDIYSSEYNETNNIQVNKHSKLIKQNSYRLLRLVNNIIDLSRLEVGYMELNMTNENIVEVIENITLSTVSYVTSTGRKIIFDTEEEEIILAFDPDKFERIMLNLISNAVKFTELGDEIIVMISKNNNYVEISVKDTGIGIPKNKQMLVFERFKQVDELLTRKREGSGIGLSLVKKLVEVQNGEIKLQSEEGKGTTFTISLPIQLTNNTKKHDRNKISNSSNVEKIHIEFADIYDN